ncbi:MAG TPA: DUF1592 domain-containing protein [Lacipirellulaceae bacterium]|jgi:cytochrome c553|nr:DUF1592 domain-containing protein [Lacipirellulaceae bacterium]
MPLQPTPRFRWHGVLATLGYCAVVAVSSACTAAETPASTGEQIYRDQCARCHGKSGDGVDDGYPDPLAGDKSVAELTKLIHETMPDDADEKCSADDSTKVAAYIFDAFYSADARTRNKPARIELSRLTVRQQQNAIADLIASFRPGATWGTERGLHGEYYSSRHFDGKARKFDQTDPDVNFDWGDSSPDPSQLEPHEFSILWQGSVLAPDTGTYEFVVRTEHASRLFVNNLEMPLIDAWVLSGNDTEHRGEIHLLGGRAYPIRLEFSRAKQGVNDKDKDTKKHEFRPDAPTSVSLEWKKPNHTLEVISRRSLSPTQVPEAFVLQTHFPPDDRSVGYERGNSVSKSWDDATTECALEAAGYVADHTQQLSGATADAPNNEPILRKFCTLFAERAFRRPLSEDQQKFFIQRQFEAAPDLLTGIKRSILLTLKSPRFLYREISGDASDEFDIAARMSFGLWDSVPDLDLASAAAHGKLKTRAEIRTQLERMLPDVRTRSKLRDFLLGWLKVSQPRDLSKDPKTFPEFTPDVASDLRTSLELSLAEMLNSNKADYRKLLLGDNIWLNGRLAKVYEIELPEDAPFQKIEFEPEHRAGILSHPYMLASLAYTGTSSPIHRGVFVSRNVLGRVLRPPAQAVAPLPAEVHAELSTRDRVSLQTQPEACQGCHGIINPLGFTMENFDAIGRYRETEKNHRIDATGAYLTQSGEVEKFKGEKDLAEFVATSDEAQTAFIKQLFHHTVKQSIFAYPNALQQLQQSFAKNDFNIKKLLVEIVTDSSIVNQDLTTKITKDTK